MHRNFYQVWTQKMYTEKKMMIDMMILRQNDGHSFIMIYRQPKVDRWTPTV